MMFISLVVIVSAVLSGPLLGILLGKIAAEEIASARKYLIFLIWCFALLSVLLIFLSLINLQLVYILAVTLFLCGLCVGVLVYNRWWG